MHGEMSLTPRKEKAQRSDLMTKNSRSIKTKEISELGCFNIYESTIMYGGGGGDGGGSFIVVAS